jgi:hypothetical protein
MQVLEIRSYQSEETRASYVPKEVSPMPIDAEKKKAREHPAMTTESND